MRSARVIGVVAAAVTVAFAAPSPAAAQVCAGPLALDNGSFEAPDVGAFAIVDQGQVPGWSTTEPDGRIELWQSGYLGVPAADGEQFAELQANEPGELTQDVLTVPGALLSYTVSHRGRDGTDTMQINIGPPGGPANFSRQVSTGNTAWQQVRGTYLVPAGQVRTRFGFQSVSSASSLISVGNFLDGIAFTAARCQVTLSKRLRPSTDSGRFELLVGDEPVVPAAGNGDASAAVQVPEDSVRVSERAVAPASAGQYASAVRCRDQQTGEVLAQAPGQQLTLTFDRPRAAACELVNLRAPAVVLSKVAYPSSAPARFDLTVNGRVVARDAGDRTTAGPVALDPGQRVVIAERPAAGTDAAGYLSAIECRERAGRGPVVARARGRRVSFVAAERQVVHCLLVNVERQPPAPSPSPGQDPGRLPEPAAASGGVGELNLVVDARAVRARVPAGGPVAFRVTVTNRGAVAAHALRVAVSTRQASVRPRNLVLLAPGAVCVPAQGVGVCAFARALAPGQSVTLRARWHSRAQLLAPVRLGAVAVAAERELRLIDNVDRARVRVIRPPVPCPAAAAAAHAAC